MVDRERVLARLDRLEGYLAELRQVRPETWEAYQASLAHRRACERLLQIAIKSVLDICALLVAGMRLGLPGEQDDLFEKLQAAGVLTEDTAARLRRMKGFRNILVHEYGEVDDRVVFERLHQGIQDFERFVREVRDALPRIAPD